MKKICIFLVSIFVSICFLCRAEDINFEIAVDKRKVVIGDAVYLNLIFEGTQDIPSLQIDNIDGFSARYSGPSTRISFVNEKSSCSITHIYILIPIKTGTFNVGPFVFDHKGNKYKSNSLKVEVVDKAGVAAAVPSPMAGQAEDLSDRIFVTLETNKKEVYLNERFLVKVKLFVSGVGMRNIAYPVIPSEGFSIVPFSEPRQYKDTVGSRYFDVIEFNTWIFATKSGELFLGPANLNCEIALEERRSRGPAIFDNFNSFFDDFFTNITYHAITLNSPGISITVLDLPQEGRPDNFQGAVGRFNFEAQVSPRELNEGDPITVKLIISGEGNLDSARQASLNLNQEEFKVYDPRISSDKGQKIFEYVVIPLKDTAAGLPEIEFSFFNPETSSYETIKKGPFDIKITKIKDKEGVKILEYSLEQSNKVIPLQKLGRDIIYIKESLGKISRRGAYLHRNVFFRSAQIIPFLFFILALSFSKHYHKIKTDEAYVKRLKAPKVARKGMLAARDLIKEGNPARFYETVFKTLQKYLGYKLHIPWKGITMDITDILRNKNIEEDMLERIKNIMSECDAVRYAPSRFNLENMNNSLERLKLVIDYLERNF